MSERYSIFYQEYKNKLFSYLVYKSRDREVSKDIMQESFTRHFEHYGNDAVLFPALLFTIARNAFVDHLRQKNKFHISENKNPQITAEQEDTLIAREETDRILLAMKGLPDLDREILLLAVGDVAYKEIAATFKLSVSNIKIRIHRARIRLRQMMENEVE